MKERDFGKLVDSVNQAGASKRGKMKPGRTIKMDPEDVRLVPWPVDIPCSSVAAGHSRPRVG